jgi:uncharacterized protein YhaN
LRAADEPAASLELSAGSDSEPSRASPKPPLPGDTPNVGHRGRARPTRQLSFAASDDGLDDDIEEIASEESLSLDPDTARRYEEDYITMRAAMQILGQKHNNLVGRIREHEERASSERASLEAQHASERAQWSEVTRSSVSAMSHKLMSALKQSLQVREELKRKVAELQTENDKLKRQLSAHNTLGFQL